MVVKMPERPPRKWFYRCVRKVKQKAPQVDNPKALCGWIWHHHARASTKRQILRAEKMRKSNPDRIIKLMKLAIKSPKTPKHLKLALRKKLKEMGI